MRTTDQGGRSPAGIRCTMDDKRTSTRVSVWNMTPTPDAPPGDVEARGDSGQAAAGSSEPQNPIGAAGEEVAQDETKAPAQAAEEIGDAAAQPADDAEQPADAAGQPADEQPDDAAAQPADVAQPDAVAPQAPAPPAAADPAVIELRTQVAELALALAASQRRADELATVARKQTEMADELHADNRRLRTGEISEAVAPLVRGLARLADDLSRMRATAAGASEDLAYLAGQVEELLHDAGVFAVQAGIGEPFDPQCHQATGSATTDVSALDRTIAEVRRSGLRRDDGRLLRPVDVVVFRYVAPPPPAAQPATEEVT